MRISARVWSRWGGWLCVGVWAVCGGPLAMVRGDEPEVTGEQTKVEVILRTTDGESAEKLAGEPTGGVQESGAQEVGGQAEGTVAEVAAGEAGRKEGGHSDANVVIPRWLGIQMGQVPEMLRKHLKLAENEGVLVISVMPQSPGEQAGLETHDVIVQLGEARVVGPGSLSKLVQESEDEVLLTVIRAGDRKVVRVVPAPWPSDLPRNVESAVVGRPGDKVERIFIQGLGPVVIRRPEEGGGAVHGEMHLQLGVGPDGAESMPGGRPQLDVLISPPSGGRETKVEAGELRADRLFFVNPGGGGPMQVMPLPPGHDPGRWERLEKSLDRLNGVLERLEKKLGN